MSIEQDLAEMLTGAQDLDEASRMRWLESMMDELGPGNRIYEWIAKIMRKHGWQTAYGVLSDYAANGCGIRG